MIDFEKLTLEFPFLSELDSTDMLEFFSYTKILNLNSGDIFLEQGSLKSNIFFVKKGLIRSYFIKENGEEITNRLRYENQVMASLEVTLFNQPSRFIFQAIEPTELIVISFHDLRQLLERNKKFESGRRFFLATTLAESLKALDEFILLSPEKRYLKFAKENPELLNRVPIKYIANVLGITPVSLSRIRKRVVTKKQ